MKIVSVHDAIGMVLCHDLTRIVPGKEKGVAFQRGHVITEEDIPEMLKIGKERIYVWDLAEGFVHEDDAAYRIASAVAGQGLTLANPKEGKIELSAQYDGLLKINTQALYEVNSLSEVMMATIHSNQRVKAGKVVAGTRIIPLVVAEEYLRNLEDICRRNFPIIEIKPFKKRLKVGIVTTGSEVYYGRIQDAFGPILRKKLEFYDADFIEQVFVSDNVDMITAAVHDMTAKGADVVMLTGGMSVDPDDVTPAAIRKTGASVVTYGVPVLPGAMFMLAFLGDVAIMGLPGCVMYHKATVFDLIFPLIQAGERPTRTDLIKYAHGGFCMGCEVCTYPHCAFGK
jgi:molybdenum cofactor synthesis domain-containing protein